MMTKITVFLSEQERAKLQAQAERDMRGLREQARFLIVQAMAADPQPADLPHAQTQPCEVPCAHANA